MHFYNMSICAFNKTYEASRAPLEIGRVQKVKTWLYTLDFFRY